MSTNAYCRASRKISGLTLIELMIALALGLIVSAAALTLFTTSRQTYLASESLGRVQENGRMAFEIMARDVREAAGNACGDIRDLTSVNTINGAGSIWYTDWAGGMRGYDGADAFPDNPFGTGERDRVQGTDAIELKSSVSTGVNIVEHNANSANFKVSTVSHGLDDGDFAMACDPAHAAIFQVTNAQPGINDTIVHNTGGGHTPGNCTKGLGGDGAPLCTTNGIAYTFGCMNGDAATCGAGEKWPATIARLQASRWFIGHNGLGGRSLYQASLSRGGSGPAIAIHEIAEGVVDMQIDYLLDGAASYVPASTAWDTQAVAQIVAVRIVLTLQGTDNVGTDGEPLERSLQHTVTIRNRAS